MKSSRGTQHARRSRSASAEQPRRRVGATRIEVTLDGLRQLLDRFDHGELEPDDRSFIRALIWNEFVRAEERNERMIAKIVAGAAAAEGASGPGLDEDTSSPVEASGSPSSSGANTSANEPEPAANGDGESSAGDSKESKPKGHGRNGASAYRQAQHVFHALALGVIGALCEVCRLTSVATQAR